MVAVLGRRTILLNDRLIKLEDTTPALENSDVIKELNKKVSQLEEDRDWLKMIGITAGSLSFLALISMGYMYWFGIKQKADAVAKEIASAELKSIAPDVVSTEMEKHPMTIEYQQKQSIKNTPFVIVGKAKKDAAFSEMLEKKGFRNHISVAINDTKEIDLNKHKLIFFNCENDQLKQKEMNKVVGMYKSGIKYFYYNNVSGARWSGSNEVDMAGFANTAKTLENRLFEALS